MSKTSKQHELHDIVSVMERERVLLKTRILCLLSPKIFPYTFHKRINLVVRDIIQRDEDIGTMLKNGKVHRTAPL